MNEFEKNFYFTKFLNELHAHISSLEKNIFSRNQNRTILQFNLIGQMLEEIYKFALNQNIDLSNNAYYCDLLRGLQERLLTMQRNFEDHLMKKQNSLGSKITNAFSKVLASILLIISFGKVRLEVSEPLLFDHTPKPKTINPEFLKKNHTQENRQIESAGDFDFSEFLPK